MSRQHLKWHLSIKYCFYEQISDDRLSKHFPNYCFISGGPNLLFSLLTSRNRVHIHDFAMLEETIFKSFMSSTRLPSNLPFILKPPHTVFPRIVSHVTLNETKRIWKIHFSKKTRDIWHVTNTTFSILKTREISMRALWHVSKFGSVWQVCWFQIE